jgi:hypothetical protein
LSLFGIIINPFMDMLENFLNGAFKKVFGIWFSYIWNITLYYLAREVRKTLVGE